ncbi:MAG: hypothetical protein Cons2KO_22690 [Congregibacter sp.]
MILALAPISARGEIVEDVYAASFPVEGRDAATLSRVRRRGLEEVVVKATGSADAAELPAVAEALDQAQEFLIGYRYEDNPDGGLSLRLDYDEAAVQRLIKSAGLPLWTVNRPPILVWLVASRDEQRSFASPEEMPEAVLALRDSFKRRGLPLQLPLFDLEDAAAISPGAAWRLSSPAIMGASQRYRGAEILSGRAAELSSGRWMGEWRFLDGGRWRNRSVNVRSFEEFTAAGAALVADTLASRYAVAPQDELDSGHRITLRGVRDFADFTALSRAIESLEVVRRVVPESVLGDLLVLRVDADSDLQQLSRIIELDGRFVPSLDANSEPGLYYEWID